MIASGHITRIVAAVMAIAVCLCFCAAAFSESITAAAGGSGVTMEYETALFDTGEVLSVNILMDEADWADMLENAISEEYYSCTVEIGGKTFYQVGIRPKSNTSLSNIANDPTTDRYSFKLEFDHYVEGQTCFGLDKLVLNNNYADATNMKEALIYDMYQYLGADASLYNYAKVSVNGEYWGVYLALEAVEDSFLLRNYGTENGALYKPDSMNIGSGKDFGDFNTDDMDFGDMVFGDMDFGGMTPPNTQENTDQTNSPAAPGQMPDTFDPSQKPDSSGEASTESSAGYGKGPFINFDFGGGMGAPPDQEPSDTGTDADTDDSDRPGQPPEWADGEMPDFGEGFGGGFGSASGGADLNYTDDDLDSYETIWDGEVTDTSKKDHKRVVAALKNISEGTEPEESMDIDNLLRYMAVHVFSVNEDSLTGSMAHNYYLYESGGQLNLIPWDYNLALGGMGGSDAGSVVNSAVDDAFSATDFFDTLMADETYHAQYYAYLRQLVEEYITGGAFDAFYTRVRSQIDTLVETDPTAFYSYDEYLTAVDTLYQVVKLRGESIQGQLDGTILSTDALLDASALDLSVMGTMNTGGPSEQAGRFERPNADAAADTGAAAGVRERGLVRRFAGGAGRRKRGCTAARRPRRFGQPGTGEYRLVVWARHGRDLRGSASGGSGVCPAVPQTAALTRSRLRRALTLRSAVLPQKPRFSPGKRSFFLLYF